MKAIDWVDERLDLSEIRHFVAEKASRFTRRRSGTTSAG